MSVILLTGLPGHSQNTVRNLVFEGAGIRGIAYSGVIKELEKQDILKGVQRVGGTSSGAITALLLSIGYSANEITTIVNSTPYKKFNDGRFFFIGGINRFQKYFGWYRGQQFEQWLCRLIEAKTNNVNITFRELKQKGCKDLYVTGTCLNKQSLIVFSNENYPDMKVKDAVRISMSIPLYFEAVFINSEGTIIH
ncbi:MAG TPA: patatin-like phospholipase family protein, partial [Flavisolibacter sp.]|nr:patatin-like phospholipase family protein [Flavisolibacter sp.]